MVREIWHRGVHLKILISWQARVSGMKCRFRGAGGVGGCAAPARACLLACRRASCQVQYFVDLAMHMLKCRVGGQWWAQDFMGLGVQISWQAQDFVDLEAGLYGPWSADFVAGAGFFCGP